VIFSLAEANPDNNPRDIVKIPALHDLKLITLVITPAFEFVSRCLKKKSYFLRLKSRGSAVYSRGFIAIMRDFTRKIKRVCKPKIDGFEKITFFNNLVRWRGLGTLRERIRHRFMCTCDVTPVLKNLTQYTGNKFSIAGDRLRELVYRERLRTHTTNDGNFIYVIIVVVQKLRFTVDLRIYQE
jgi:hypothetical protein